MSPQDKGGQQKYAYASGVSSPIEPTGVPPNVGLSELGRSSKRQDDEAEAHAEIGDSGDAGLDWQLYGTAETSQLTKAIDDKATGFAIINACEVSDAAIDERLNRPWYRRLLPSY